MRMPASAFFALNAKITRLQAEEEAIAISVTHNGKPEDRMKELVERIRGIKHAAPSSAMVYQAVAGEAEFESTPGEIAALRERQRQSAEKIKQERQAWLEQVKAQRAQPPTTSVE